MAAIDVNSLFSRAEQAFAAGRLDEARADLQRVQAAAGEHPAILHLLALVEKKRGDGAAAESAFRRAAELAPDDSKILANHANLLVEAGRHDEAMALYDRALSLQPGFDDARFNRAILLQKMGRLDEALAALEAALRGGVGDARIHSARGSILRQLGRLDEAADAFDDALRFEPKRLTALHGRARVAMERGEENASAFYVRALEVKPGDREMVLGCCEALEAEGRSLGLEIMKKTVEASPDWVEGHQALARMRSEAGEGDAFADHYRESLKARPQDLALHRSYWDMLLHAGRAGEALEALREARFRLPEDPGTKVVEAILMSEAGDPRGALDLLPEAPDEDYTRLFARGRIALQAGDSARAAASLEAATRLDPDSIAAWAHVGLAWRLTGDKRHEWLCGQPGLHAARDIGLDENELAGIADLLRSLHRASAHPIGQSLRGGTQTRGRLFARGEPALARLRDAIFAQVQAHMDELPPRDDAHPLLRHRDGAVAIEGSWSVRLVSQGFHVHHIHPEGILSSACYIALPATLGDEATKDGWLEIGRPPVELGLDLEPLAVIEPRPGRLALFPSYMFHGTRPFEEGERLTVAFDVVPR